MSEATYCVTYSGSDVVQLGKVGLFQNGTIAYVGEPDANTARSLKNFTVTGPFGGTPKVERKTADEATASEDAARAKAQPAAPAAAPAPAPAPAPKPAPAPAPKAEEKKPEAPKAEEKKSDAPKAEEKKPEAAPAAVAAS